MSSAAFSPACTSSLTSSLWARRRASKTALASNANAIASAIAPAVNGSVASFKPVSVALPTGRTSSEVPRSEVDMNVLSLVLDMPVLELDRVTSPTSARCRSPWSPHTPSQSPHALNHAGFDSSEALDQLQGSDRGLLLEISTARTAVTSAFSLFSELDDEGDVPAAVAAAAPSWSKRASDGLFVATAGHPSHAPWSGLGAPLHQKSRSAGYASSLPSPTMPVSPADSTFTLDGEPTGEKKKGRARMSQEKRKRLARRREREAAMRGEAFGLAAQQQPQQQSQQPVQPLQQLYTAPATQTMHWSERSFDSTVTGSPWTVDVHLSSSPVWESFSLPSLPEMTSSRSSSDSASSSSCSSNRSTPYTSPAKSVDWHHHHHYQQQSQQQLGMAATTMPGWMSPTAARKNLLQPPTLVVEPPSPQRGNRW
ncbi:hypothetical protein ACQY0O_006598 [Thecaphora frezii]